MSTLNTDRQWGWPAKLFHWVVGLGIIAMLIGGFMMTTGIYWLMPEAEAFQVRFEWTQWHKSFGFVIFFLALARLVWRWFQPTNPELPPDTNGLERLAANASHGLMYALMLALPLTGWAMASTSPLNDDDAYPEKVPNMVFGAFEMPDAMQPGDREVSNVFALLHEWAGWALAALLVVHVGAALKHHLIDRDTVLRRMLPGRLRGEAAE